MRSLVIGAVGVAFLSAASLAGAADAPVRLSAKPSVQEIMNALNPPLVGSGSSRGMERGAAVPRAAAAYAPILFALNSAELTAEAKGFLDAFGAALNDGGMRSVPVRIEGHTDATGSAAYNLVLSQLRAAAVRDYLVTYSNVDPRRLAIAGKGMTEPLPGISQLSAENRRVQFVNTGG